MKTEAPSKARKPSRNIWAALVVIAALLPVGVQAEMLAHTDFLFDLGTFYCAGRVVSHGANPYQAEPLRTCEHAVIPGLSARSNASLAVPAPLPGYAIAAFAPLSLLPFPLAAVIWIALLFIAWFACVATLVRFAGSTWQTGLAAFSLSLGAISIPLGQLVPIAVAAVCASAFFAWGELWSAAAIAAAAAMIEPHLGLPCCLALAVWAPRTRITLGISFGVLAAASLLVIGTAANLDYVRNVLPAHALSEAAFNAQYSLTCVLVSLGVADTAAVRAGSLWYLAMLAVGVTVAGLLANKTKNKAFLVCVPPAFAVYGGVFVHLTQIAVAVPAALLFLPYAKAERRWIAIPALLLLAVPWRMAVSPAALIAPIFPIAYLTWRLWPSNLRAAFVAAVLCALLFLAVDHAYLTPSTQHLHAYAGTILNARLAEASWSEYLRGYWTPTAASWIVRVPTWVGLTIFLAVLSAAALPIRRATALAELPNGAH